MTTSTGGTLEVPDAYSFPTFGLDELMSQFVNAPEQLLPYAPSTSVGAHHMSKLPVNMYATAEGLAIDIEIPGTNLSDINVEVGDRNAVYITAHRSSFHPHGAVMRSEIPAGVFHRILHLPKWTDPTTLAFASFKHGVLHLACRARVEHKHTPRTRIQL